MCLDIHSLRFSSTTFPSQRCTLSAPICQYWGFHFTQKLREVPAGSSPTHTSKFLPVAKGSASAYSKYERGGCATSWFLVQHLQQTVRDPWLQNAEQCLQYSFCPKGLNSSWVGMIPMA